MSSVRLTRGHAADPADREALVGDAHHPPRPRPGLRRRVDALLELDTKADHGELLPRCDAERDEVVADLRAHRDERRRRGRERPLEHPEEAGADRPEVAAEDVAVEGVHDDRRACVTGEQGGRAADSARFRGVRVQDVRTQPADERGKPVRGPEIVQRRDLAVEIGQRDDLDALPLCDVCHRALPARERPGDERCLVAALFEAGGQVRDMERRPALVQPGNDPEDPDGLRQDFRSSGADRPRVPRAAPSRALRGRRSDPPTSCGGHPPGAVDTSSRAACRATARSSPQAH